MQLITSTVLCCLSYCPTRELPIFQFIHVKMDSRLFHGSASYWNIVRRRIFSSRMYWSWVHRMTLWKCWMRLCIVLLNHILLNIQWSKLCYDSKNFNCLVVKQTTEHCLCFWSGCIGDARLFECSFYLLVCPFPNSPVWCNWRWVLIFYC